VEVILEYYWFAWFYLLKPVVIIDDEKHFCNWGTHFFNLKPGNHHIKVYFKYLYVEECGVNSLDFKVEAGKVTSIKYHMPMWIAAKGSIKVI